MHMIDQRDTRAWRCQVWASFSVAVFRCATGLNYLPGQAIDRALMVMGCLFCRSVTFVLSKFVRDNQTTKIDTPTWRWVVFGAFGFAMMLRDEVDGAWRSTKRTKPFCS